LLQNDGSALMIRLNDKAIQVLSTLLLSEKPLSTIEIAKKTGYFRQTIDPYITKLIECGYISDNGRDKYHGWIINEGYKQNVLDFVMSNGVKLG
jgi:predicted transcriptional regulator